MFVRFNLGVSVKTRICSKWYEYSMKYEPIRLNNGLQGGGERAGLDFITGVNTRQDIYLFQLQTPTSRSTDTYLNGEGDRGGGQAEGGKGKIFICFSHIPLLSFTEQPTHGGRGREEVGQGGRGRGRYLFVSDTDR